jgi:hypothetical protein
MPIDRLCPEGYRCGSRGDDRFAPTLDVLAELALPRKRTRILTHFTRRSWHISQLETELRLVSLS